MAPIRIFTGWFIRKTLRLIAAAVLGLVLAILLTSTVFAEEEEKYYSLRSATFGPYDPWSTVLFGSTASGIAKSILDARPSPYNAGGAMAIGQTFDTSCVKKSDILNLLNQDLTRYDLNSNLATRIGSTSVSAGSTSGTSFSDYTVNFVACTGTGSRSSTRKSRALSCANGSNTNYVTSTYSVPISVELHLNTEPACTGITDVICYDASGTETACHYAMYDVHDAMHELATQTEALDEAVGSGLWHTTMTQCNDAHFQRGVSERVGDVTYCSSQCPDGYDRSELGICVSSPPSDDDGDDDGGDDGGDDPTGLTCTGNICDDASLGSYSPAPAGSEYNRVTFLNPGVAGDEYYLCEDGSKKADAHGCPEYLGHIVTESDLNSISTWGMNGMTQMGYDNDIYIAESQKCHDAYKAANYTDEARTIHQECLSENTAAMRSVRANYLQDWYDHYYNELADNHYKTVIPEVIVATDTLEFTVDETDDPTVDVVVEEFEEPSDAGLYEPTCVRGCDAYLSPPTTNNLSPIDTLFKYRAQTSRGYHAIDYDQYGTPQPDTVFYQKSDGTWTADADAMVSDMKNICTDYIEGTGVSGSASVVAVDYDAKTVQVACNRTENLLVKTDHYNSDRVEDSIQTKTVKRHVVTRSVSTTCPTETLCSGYSHGRETVPETPGDDGGGDGEDDGDCEAYSGDLDDDNNVIETTVVTCEGDGDDDGDGDGDSDDDGDGDSDCEAYSGDLDDAGEVIQSTVVTCDGDDDSDGDGECIPLGSDGLSLYGTTSDLPACASVGEGSLPSINLAQTCVDDNGNETTEGCATTNQDVVDRMEDVQENLAGLIIQKLGLNSLHFSAECPKWEADVPMYEEPIVLEIDCSWLEYIGIFMVLSSTALAVRMVLV